jgi:hypothetical protein
MTSNRYQAIFLAALLGCQPGGGTEISVARDSAGVTIIENIGPALRQWMLAQEPRVVIGMLERPEQYQFTLIIGALRLPDSRIVAANFTKSSRRMVSGGLPTCQRWPVSWRMVRARPLPRLACKPLRFGWWPTVSNRVKRIQTSSVFRLQCREKTPLRMALHREVL